MKETNGKTHSTALLRPDKEPPKENLALKPISVTLAEHLLGLAKKVVEQDINPQTVSAACKCASEIHKLLDLQWRTRR
jgi:hypothetical protein